MVNKQNGDEDLASDILWGCKAIGKFLGIKEERKVYYMVERKQIPTKKIGHRTLVASRRELRKLFGGDDA
jgi:hypothetical protein